MDDSEILERIRTMVDAEHQLRSQLQESPGQDPHAHQSLRQIEESLDQCWDLLRQRRAHRDFQQDPEKSQPRPIEQVEHYLQ